MMSYLFSKIYLKTVFYFTDEIHEGFFEINPSLKYDSIILGYIHLCANSRFIGGPLPLIGSKKVSSRIVDSIYVQIWLLIKSEE